MQIPLHVNLKGQEYMKIAGLLKTSLLDYPGRLCASVYLAGCNLHCPFCHNSSLLKASVPSACSPDELMDFLKKRRSILEGVCISGGEPALDPDLPNLLHHIKSLGYSVKLDTNGTYPQILSALISDGLIDHVAMDIKGSPEKYPEICGMDPDLFSIEPISHSIELLHKQEKISFEFRTTVIREFHSPEDFHKICQWIAPASVYALQLFRNTDTVLDKSLHACSADQMENFRSICLTYIPGTIIRGMD